MLSNSLKPCGLQPTSLLCPWDFPGKNTGVDAFIPLGDLHDPGIESVSPVSPALLAYSLPPGKPPGLLNTQWLMPWKGLKGN